ncbi:M20/M25/M40 family metallo-hydrolase [Arundinibacter roseus]|uniref:M20/M25/M40 family metallo-hydrolase n=1 Tax=Arundinibacter roseus TaxID=2070510 RepID=A0A4R4KQB2_9BACT|nr:M20/M25/M40 family metallo-hydrolase [Arundinibacter roseus]TDB68779.1 M20/M25/M40 family metallo-hydrolase [Arundinibacter roseus]
MKKILYLCSFGLLLISPAFGQKGKSLPEFNLQKVEREAHMRFLASDELQGRRTGEPGNLVAARYIAEQFRRLGLTPAPGQSGQSGYMQPVPLEKLGSVGEGMLIAGNDTLVQKKDWILMAGSTMNIDAPLAYAGFGLEDVAKGWDDYKGLDVKGKIVLVQSGSSEATTPSDIISASTQKRRIAAEKGAVAVIELFKAPIPWNFVVNYFSGERLSLADGTAPVTLPHAWVNGSEAALTKLLRAATSLQIKTDGRLVQPINGFNVAAYIQGSDAKLKDEYVLLTAHYDHVGVGKQGGQPYTAEDSIFNGARDNAFGVVALLSAAEALAQNPPKRSVLLVALTGEEVGLLGSKYLANHPLLPWKQCIFNLNSDGAGYNDTSILSVIGLDRTGARAEIETASKAFGLDVVADPSPEQGLFDRSDNVSFAAKGIPAPTMTPGFRAFDAELMKNYHQVSDNPDTIDFNYLLKFSQAYAYAARLIADRALAPKWVAGDKYEEASFKLYGQQK